MRSLTYGGALLIAAGLAIGLWMLFVQGPLPGDVFVTQALQARFGHMAGWANIVTKTATEPWMWVMTAGVAALLWIMQGQRMALAVPVAFSVMIALDGLLRYFIHAPRPLATLVAVAKPSASSGLPSTFGLVAGATAGLLMLVGWQDGRLFPRLLSLLALFYLVAGLCARVTMGGHWASQVLASYGVAMGLAYGIARLIGRI